MAKKVPGLVLPVIAAVILMISPASSKSTVDLTDAGASARQIGLGKAFTAVVGDPASIFVNPAGLSTINSVDLTTMYTTYMDDNKLTLIGATYPFEYGILGFGYAGNFSGDSAVTTMDSTGRVVDTGGRLNYTANQLVVSYATRFGGFPVFFESMRNMTFGVNGKLYLQSMTGPGGGTASGFDIDAGFLYKHNRSLIVSALAKNLLPSTGGQLGTLVWSTNAKDNIPSLLKFGAGLKVLGSDGLMQAGGQQLDVSFDLDTDMANGKPSLLHAGFEWKPVNMLALRAGLDQDQAVGMDTRVANNMTVGVGLKAGNFGFDYAYRAYSALAENSAHYFSFNMTNLLGGKVVEVKEFVPPAPTKGLGSPARPTPSVTPMREAVPVKVKAPAKKTAAQIKAEKKAKAKAIKAKKAASKKKISRKPAKKKVKAVKKTKKSKAKRRAR